MLRIFSGCIRKLGILLASSALGSQGVLSGTREEAFYFHNRSMRGVYVVGGVFLNRSDSAPGRAWQGTYWPARGPVLRPSPGFTQFHQHKVHAVQNNFIIEYQRLRTFSLDLVRGVVTEMMTEMPNRFAMSATSDRRPGNRLPSSKTIHRLFLHHPPKCSHGTQIGVFNAAAVPFKGAVPTALTVQSADIIPTTAMTAFSCVLPCRPKAQIKRAASVSGAAVQTPSSPGNHTEGRGGGDTVEQI